ncbi:SCO1/SenC-domain-containing protein [Naematelia encephala]|uniref:SCO1/SenC-domain-containing protein n=1 Tax=Naematelia encephala TaxID=71784 RepID=A0A1Y2AXY2_9TREE|nr:SCO1/SenC-domain-containing protein [Naematelia encephala]
MNTLRSALTRTVGSSSRQALAQPARRAAAQVPRRGYAVKREQVFRDKANVGPVSWTSAVIFIATGFGLYFYFESEKAKVQKRKQDEMAAKSIGRPNIGGPFQLVNSDGSPYTEQNLRGHWTLIYFGFTNCPDICPEELDKMGEAVDKVGSDEVLPLFVSVDPARDSPEQVKKYIKDFHPRLVGLTGDYDAIKRACKSYRVYFSTPPNAKPTDDYLVDHSIFFYLMDPLGQFVDAFGKATTADEVADKVRTAMGKWEAAGGNVAAGLPVKV